MFSPIHIIIGVGTIVILYTIYYIYRYIRTHASKDILEKITPLNVKKDILYSDITQSTILATSGSTVMGFFKLNNGDRTVKYSNSFMPLMYIDNNWYLEVSPAPINNVAARLRVQTNNGGAFNDELIDLPNIPKQKWLFIAILRDGRRFDVIYNNKIVASQRLINYPVVISSSLSIGNKGFDGSAIHIIINGKRLSPTDVERERVKYVDTNDMIMEDNQIDISLPGFKVFAQCPSGLPCTPITEPPTNKLLEWSTPYA